MANTLEFIIKATDQASKIVGEIEKKITGSTKSIGLSLTDLKSGFELVGMGIEKLKQAWDFAKEGAAIQRIGTQWAATARDFGVNGDKIIAAVDKVTGRTLDDEAIMQAASRTLTQGLVSDGDQIVDMFKIAQAASVRFGGSAIDAYQGLSMAIETGMTRQLKAQGIIVDFEAAYDKYATAIGKTKDQLTEEVKVEIRRNEVLAAGADLVNKVGDATNDSLSKMQRFERQMGDIVDTLKEGAVDILGPMLDKSEAIGTAMNKSADAATRLAAAQQVGQDALTVFSFQNIGLVDSLREQVRLEDLQTESIKNSTIATTALVNEFAPLFEKFKIAQTFKPLTDVLFPAKKEVDLNKATDMSALTSEKSAEAAKQYQAMQKSLADIETKGDEERRKIFDEKSDEITKLESDAAKSRAEIIRDFATNAAAALGDMRDKQIDILTSYAADEAKITNQQNQDRLKLAQNYGVEVERMEQSHQLSMARMSEDHGRRLSKLADSRDALGIQDEMSNYNVERRRAEEDYQITARQKSEDYARQLADQNAAFEEQRQAREAEKNKQLKELNDQYVKTGAVNQAAKQKELDDLDAKTTEERQTILDAQGIAIRDLEAGLIEERNATNTAWTQWRNEHDIFFAGERAAYDAYLKYTYDQLQVYIGRSGGAPSGIAGAPFAKNGLDMIVPPGYNENFPIFASSGERVLIQNSGQRGASGGNAFNVTINVAGTNATVAQIEDAAYGAITRVMQAAMR